MRHSEHKGMACDKARRMAELYMLDDPSLSAGHRCLPADALLTDVRFTSAWEEKTPDLDEIIEKMTKISNEPGKSEVVPAVVGIRPAAG